MKRHEIKTSKPKATQTRNPSEIRQEIDTATRFITQAINKDPKKAAKIFEGWLNTTASVDKKRRAA